MELTVDSAHSPTQNIEHALHYASKGWGVFPAHTIENGRCSCGKPDCHSPGKHPRIRDWPEEATTDKRILERWWKKYPTSNIAIRTGAESGLVALDIDTKSNGFSSLETLENTFEELPETLTAVTGSKGKHICFSHPGIKLKTRTGILDGIDFRGDGGCIIAPPSLHFSGNKYYWINDLNDRLESPPPWLIELVNGDHGRPTENQAVIPEGRRNSTLMSIAGKIWSEGCSKSALHTLLLEENKIRCAPPLPHEEVLRIAKSVTRYKQGEEKFIHTWKEQFMNSDLPSQSKLVLYCLASHMNSQGRSCFPTQGQISSETSLTTKTVRKHLTYSADMGWIDRYVHYAGSQKYWNHGYIARLPDG